MGAAAAVSGATTSMAGAYAQSKALKTQGQYQEHMSRINAQFTEMQADDALRRGAKEAEALQKQTKTLIGTQRAATAAQGVDVNEDTAAEIQMQTAALSAEDQMTIKHNARREAWGYRMQAEQMVNQGTWANAAARHAAKSTMLTGMMQAAGYAAKAGVAMKAPASTPKQESDSEVSERWKTRSEQAGWSTKGSTAPAASTNTPWRNLWENPA